MQLTTWVGPYYADPTGSNWREQLEDQLDVLRSVYADRRALNLGLGCFNRQVWGGAVGRRERHDCARLFVGSATVIMAAAWEEAVESIDCAGCAQKHGMSV